MLQVEFFRRRTLDILFAIISSAAALQAQTASSEITREIELKDAALVIKGPSAVEGEAVIRRFMEAEDVVRRSLNQHTFKRDVVLQTIGPLGEVTGEYVRNSQFLFDDRGRRIERVLFHPSSTIREMRITKEDIQDLASAQLLGIDIAEATKYYLTFAGAEILESRQLYAIDVRPRVQPDPHRMSERYFIGRVWLDPNTFQIVKIRGTVEPHGKQRFPVFETWREPLKNDLAFPARTTADDILHFNNRDVHYRIKVRYYDYRLFASKVSVTELNEPVPDNDVPPSEKPLVQAKRKQSLRTDKVVTCTANQSAPPVGPYHWPLNEEVKVYFVNGMFPPEQRRALLDAMTTWTTANQENGSGVTFHDAGETSGRMSCQACLTVGRRDVHKRDKHSYAFFNPLQEAEGRLLVSAWIDLDFGIKNPQALKGFMLHELAHGLGLWDCATCKKKLTIMNGFPGVNRDNGLLLPSTCDLATVKHVYQEEFQVTALKLYNPPQNRSASFLQRIGAGLDAGGSALSGELRAESCRPSSLLGFFAPLRADRNSCGFSQLNSSDALSY